MHRLSSIILFLFGFLTIYAQSPHGDELKIDCAQCHNPEGWSINYETISFSHDITEFPLEGTHVQVDCKLCHPTLTFENTPSDCISCHTDVHSMTVGNDCIRCHSAESWLVDYIPELHEENGFPLTGVHSTSSCVDCHASEPLLQFERIGNECINCHREDYAATQHPNHTESGFSTNCIECHSTLGLGWETDLVDHDFFPLTLGHDIQDCKQCHTTGNYSDVSSDCVSCHQNDYASTQNPNHESTGFSTDCASCHTTNPGWTPAAINHDFFPLTLGHDIQDCKQCHTTDNYSDVSSDCVSCHQNDYASTQNPDHESTGFSTDCASCHTTNPGWTPAAINHDFFPLTLGHDIQDCKQCHTTPNYSDVSADCVSCHQEDYAATTDPNHQSSGISTDCASCHTTNPGWTPATINHDFFPLTLGHDIQDCKQCHTTGNYADVSADCVSCHQEDYAATTDPNHQSSGISTDCASCHTTNPGWTPATINHDFFPLTLGHDIQDCKQCHTTGNYADVSADCVSCHQNDYDQTNDPNHLAAQFPTDCVACHTTNPGWTPATFDHDGQYFPIYSGKHREGEAWNSCVECHTNPASYAVFTCFTCHSQSESNNDHSEVSGYIYDSNACLECHPDGNN
jgi:hypothetical protein